MNQPTDTPADRDTIAAEYFDTLTFAPYPVQEEALLAYYTAESGVLVCAPTGTGKTLIAEAAVYEALRTGKQCYYTTPLIALTDQKLQELSETVQRWGYPADSVGLVTGSRRVNPDAPILVVVAEILLNRLLHPDAFSMDDCLAVVMDEFHCFNDNERGIVWEMTLGFLPPHIKTLLLSATVGNSIEFLAWLRRAHGRHLELVQGTERKVPLAFNYIVDKLLDEHLEYMYEGDEETRRTPALLFCFNRDQCWQVAEMLRGKRLVDKPRQALLSDRLAEFDMSQGAGPKLKTILQRGIGVHHAGVLPRYRRVVETLFQEKLLSVAVCTETLAAGINLPARSVVLPSIVKGPKDKKRLMEAATAHQIFGRAGRPQYDTEGFVYVLAHEDDVKHLRWKEKFDQIPEDTKDPGLMRAKKQLKKKMPKRREGETYWTQAQFETLRTAASAKLVSKGDLPWRLLAYLLEQSAEVQPLRDLVGRRLMSDHDIQIAQKRLNQMLITLWSLKYISLEPAPRAADPAANNTAPGALPKLEKTAAPKLVKPEPPTSTGGLFANVNLSALHVKSTLQEIVTPKSSEDNDKSSDDDDDDSNSADKTLTDEPVKYELVDYKPITAQPKADLPSLLHLRSVNPLFGIYMADLLKHADVTERIMALESMLELPANVAAQVRVPGPDILPHGPLANNYLHPRLLELGLATVPEILGRWTEDEDEDEEEQRAKEQFGRRLPPPWPLSLGEKVLRLFRYDVPTVHDVAVRGVWVVGELLNFNGDFFKYIQAHGLQKQEGILFRHILRFTMLCDEIASIPPIGSQPEDWEDVFDDLIEKLSASCRAVDPESTEEILANKLANDELLSGTPRTLRRT